MNSIFIEMQACCRTSQPYTRHPLPSRWRTPYTCRHGCLYCCGCVRKDEASGRSQGLLQAARHCRIRSCRCCPLCPEAAFAKKTNDARWLIGRLQAETDPIKRKLLSVVCNADFIKGMKRATGWLLEQKGKLLWDHFVCVLASTC